MALFGIGKSVIEVLNGKRDGKTYKLCIDGDMTLQRGKNNPSCLKFKCYRDMITPEDGEFISFKLDQQHNCFFGVVTNTSKEANWVDVTAYDFLFYWNQNTYTRNFGNIKASDLFIKMCKDFGFPINDPPNVADTQHVIPGVIMDKEKPLNLIVDALNITKENTGITYYIWDSFGNLCLDRPDNPDTLMVTDFCLTNFNCENHTYTQDLPDLRNYIEITTKEEDKAKSKTAIAQNADSITNYGRLTYSDEAKDGENIQNVANTVLAQKNGLKTALKATGVIGEPRIWGGSSIYVDLFTNGRYGREYIRGWFSVDSVTHKFSKGLHTMDLDLSVIRMDADWNNKELIM